jgi:D-alanyl-D-alanine carboxypeptidase
MKVILIVLYLFWFGGITIAQSYDNSLQNMIDSFYQSHPDAGGIMMHVESPGKNISWTYAVGYSEKNTKKPIDPFQPALTASNTKTYVAAAILKLVEQRKLDIEQSIDDLVNVKTNTRLLKAGYKTDEIKIKHLLSHTSGIADYVDDDYFDFVNTHKRHQWTRDEQIKLATTIGKPLSIPGDTFVYADINYLLATKIIEGVTKRPYYEAIGELLEFDKNSLHTTWFIRKQQAPKQSLPLVHQYYTTLQWDSYDLNPSWDLYGGGGIATTTQDLARFFHLLFEGKIIQDTNLLNVMCSPVYAKANYGLGIINLKMNGYTGYYHGGWWGTDAIYFPELKTSIAIFVLERSQKDISSKICMQAQKLLAKK